MRHNYIYMTSDQKQKIDDIVVELYDKRHKYYNYYKKNVPRHYWDDLFTTVVEALYKNPEATCKAIDKKQHVFLATRITMNQWASTTSPFYKQFRYRDNDEAAVLNATEDFEDGLEKQEMEIKYQLVHEALRNLPLSFYEDQLIRMYYVERTHVKRIAKMHGISTNTVYANIVKATDKMKQGIAHYLHTGNWDSNYIEVNYDIVQKRNNGKPIIWFTSEGSVRAEFVNINEAAVGIGKKKGYLYAKLAENDDTKYFKDGSWLEYGKKKNAL